MSSRDGRGGLWRSRWAAIGAAVAITFGAGGLVAVNAAGGVDSTTVMIDPARVLDSRDPTNVGLPGPFASQVSQKLRVTGSVATTTGVKTVVPDYATGVLLNVTTVNSTANGFISIRPGDATGQPATSSLNFKVGDVVPNAVSVALPTDGAYAGQIDITYDAYGATGPTTDILIDVVGYTTSDLSDLVDAIAAALPFAVSARVAGFGVTTTTEFDLVSVQLTAPFDGHVTVNTSTSAYAGAAGRGAKCWITYAGAPIDWAYVQWWESAGIGNRGTLAGTRLFSVQSGVTYNFALRCQGTVFEPDPSLAVVLAPAVITAIYTPAP